MVRGGRDNRLTYVQNLSCGAAAGLVSRTLTSPLDVVKIRMQVGTRETLNHGFLRSFANIYHAHGVRAYWKGNLIGCLRLSPFSAIQFLTFSRFKVMLADDNGRLTASKAMLVAFRNEDETRARSLHRAASIPRWRVGVGCPG